MAHRDLRKELLAEVPEKELAADGKTNKWKWEPKKPHGFCQIFGKFAIFGDGQMDHDYV